MGNITGKENPQTINAHGGNPALENMLLRKLVEEGNQLLAQVRDDYLELGEKYEALLEAHEKVCKELASLKEKM